MPLCSPKHQIMALPECDTYRDISILLMFTLTSFSEELADNRTSCASKNSESDSVIEALLSLDTWCMRARDSSTESCF